jgi:hypothetical protein
LKVLDEKWIKSNTNNKPREFVNRLTWKVIRVN